MKINGKIGVNSSGNLQRSLVRRDSNYGLLFLYSSLKSKANSDILDAVQGSLDNVYS